MVVSFVAFVYCVPASFVVCGDIDAFLAIATGTVVDYENNISDTAYMRFISLFALPPAMLFFFSLRRFINSSYISYEFKCLLSNSDSASKPETTAVANHIGAPVLLKNRNDVIGPTFSNESYLDKLYKLLIFVSIASHFN